MLGGIIFELVFSWQATVEKIAVAQSICLVQHKLLLCELLSS